MSPTGIDQSWGYADPKQAAAAGVQVVSMYLSHDSSKNMTPAKVKAYHAQGIAVLFNWESDAGRPLLGAAAGRADAVAAVALAKAIIHGAGYGPKNRASIYFSCDRDVNSSQFPTIDAYYKAARDACHANGFGVGVYGEASLVHHLAAATITDSEWQTLAWSGGVLDPAADFYQSSINNTLGGASVDFDKVIHPLQLGAWWPPNHPLNTEAGMARTLTDDDVAAIVRGVWSATYTKNGVTTSMQNWCASADFYAGQAAVASQAIQKQLASSGGPVAVTPTDVPVTGTLHIGGAQ